ncbi:MAG: bifunctional diaminohydroxyphosphoribosylaminopyrimidine deaminase/5-amino-6-(5-phosphoribosylamino)uracil reductase RibD [Planctomycetota bacterium]|jgi:diaminohydroxyphosphoribosylaminopyrimidine deaminase/5-amino-6-(5-phosphoribosylamino)uracil reductase
MANEDEKFMRIALALASRGRGAVEPNPMVGAVIVRDGVEVARGWHKRFGGPHAEVEAIEAARQAGKRIRGATMYVTLEPCCHHAKTPPCTELLIEQGLARAVVAMTDPDRRVAGRGIESLRAAGIDVTVGVCRAEARELLAAYTKLRSEGRPWVICKWAQTADGYLSLPAGAGRWVSGEKSRAYANELRGLCDAVAVGVGALLADDPLLTNRSGRGKQPARLVLDSGLRTPLDCRLVATAGESLVIVATTRAGLAAKAAHAERLRAAGAELLEIPPSVAGLRLDALLSELGRRDWTYLLVEGGAKLLASFVYANMADEAVVFVSPRKLGRAGAALPRLDINDVLREVPMRRMESRPFESDMMCRYVL